MEPPRDGVERASGVERVARAAGRAMDGGARSTSTHGMSGRQPSGSRGASGARASGKRETSRLEMLEALERELDETESLVFDAGAARRDAREDSRGQNDRAREASGSGTATTSMVGAFFGDAQERSRAGRAATEFYGADDGDADARGDVDDADARRGGSGAREERARETERARRARHGRGESTCAANESIGPGTAASRRTKVETR